MANKEMWDEMAKVKLPHLSVEYAEEKPLNEQYEECKQEQKDKDISKSDIIPNIEQSVKRYKSLNNHFKKLQNEFGVNDIQELPITTDYGLSFAYYYAAYLGEVENKKKLKKKSIINYYLSLAALGIAVVAFIINFVRIL